MLLEDPVLDRFALRYAKAMVAAGIFGHTLPNGVTFADRVRKARLRVQWAAENLAADVDSRSAHAALVRSAPHYANMMSRLARHMGAAVVRGTDGLAVIVEEFSD